MVFNNLTRLQAKFMITKPTRYEGKLLKQHHLHKKGQEYNEDAMGNRNVAMRVPLLSGSRICG